MPPGVAGDHGTLTKIGVTASPAQKTATVSPFSPSRSDTARVPAPNLAYSGSNDAFTDQLPDRTRSAVRGGFIGDSAVEPLGC